MLTRLLSLALFIGVSSAHAEEIWEGVHAGEGALSTYRVHLFDEPQEGENGYVIAHGPGFGTCYVPFKVNFSSDEQLVLIGITDGDHRMLEGVEIEGCWTAGWEQQDKLMFVLKPAEKTLEVFVDGTSLHTAQVQQAQ